MIMSLFGPIYILTALFVTLLDWLTEEKNEVEKNISSTENEFFIPCLLYTSDAADE